MRNVIKCKCKNILQFMNIFWVVECNILFELSCQLPTLEDSDVGFECLLFDIEPHNYPNV